jgi:hypothetical protein
MLPASARAVVCGFLIGSAILDYAPAKADEIDRCLASHAEAQRSRREGKLRAARAELLVCARALCPRVVRTECGRWVAEVEELLPGVVISARTPAGEDLTDVRIMVDGEPALSGLDGRPLPLDPGPHRIRLEAPGRSPQEQTFLIVQGETARPLTFTLASDADRATPQRPLAQSNAGTEAKPSAAATYRPTPPAVYFLGGVGTVALGSFAVFGLIGRSEYLDLDSSCAPHCTTSETAPVRNKLLIADVSLGVAVVALGVGATLFFTRPAVGTVNALRAIHLDLRAREGGAAVSTAWAF